MFTNCNFIAAQSPRDRSTMLHNVAQLPHSCPKLKITARITAIITARVAARMLSASRHARMQARRMMSASRHADEQSYDEPRHIHQQMRDAGKPACWTSRHKVRKLARSVGEPTCWARHPESIEAGMLNSTTLGKLARSVGKV